MAQASSAQREPSMEEILASIRRIIEDNDAGRRQPSEPERSQARPVAPAAAERTVIEVDAFRNELRTPPAVAERAAPERIAAERPVAERAPYERSPDDIKKAIENSRAAREDARALLGIPAAANSARTPEQIRSAPEPARETAVEERPAIGSQSRPAVPEVAAVKPALLSERVERQVAASFSELSEAFAARSQKRFDELAEEMIEPLLRDWMENNLPTLVERLVREEIERVARGAQ